jgi:hypothetical protein
VTVYAKNKCMNSSKQVSIMSSLIEALKWSLLSEWDHTFQLKIWKESQGFSYFIDIFNKNNE